jgi:predicted amidophosphoribosyltransferase
VKKVEGKVHTSVDGCVALGTYRDPVLRAAIEQAKYVGDQDVWRVIDGWIHGATIEALLPAGPWTICPIPLHKARARERGFNQAERMARILAGVTGWPSEMLLSRMFWTDPQARKQNQERCLGDLEGIFEVTNWPSARILLCDDVLTSGATMDAAARALKAAGACEVWGFALAMGSRG